MNKTILTVFVCFLLLIHAGGCGKSDQNISGNNNNIDNLFTIENKSSFRQVKASLDIRLKKAVDKQKITAIAQKLRKNNKGYERLFICYYLPDMKIGSGAWATSHFNPDLKVNILGMTQDEESELISKKDIIKGKILGKWIDRGGVGGIYTIFEDDGILKLNVKYKDGSSSKKDLKKKIVKEIKRLYQNSQEYFIINSNGTLGIYDDEMGLIRTFKKLN